MYSKEILPELRLRWDKLAQGVEAAEADALLISSNVNLFYVSGRIFCGYCYLIPGRDPLFFVRRPIGLAGENTCYIRKVEEIPGLLCERGLAKPKKWLLETGTVSYNEILRLSALFPHATLGDGSGVLQKARAQKTPYEIELLKRSGKQHTAMYNEIAAQYRDGMTDVAFSIELERLGRLYGSLGQVRIAGQSMEIFMGSVLAGENADTPSPYDFAMGGAGLDASLPVGGNGTVIAPGHTVMVDIGGNFTGYMTDMSRVFSLGDISVEARKAHQVSIEIQRAIQEYAKPGIKSADLYQLALELAKRASLESYFMGHRQQAGFIGHGVGLELNELPVLAPRSKDVLQPGMVFALEPKFVIPGVGPVGIENTFVVTESGIEKITNSPEPIIPLVGEKERCYTHS